jgi:hypothetical protein
MDLNRLFNKRTPKSVFPSLGLEDDRLDRLLEGVSWLDAALVLFEPALSIALAVVDIGGINRISCRLGVTGIVFVLLLLFSSPTA